MVTSERERFKLKTKKTETIREEREVHVDLSALLLIKSYRNTNVWKKID